MGSPRKIEKNGQQDWIIVPDAHEALVSRELFRRAQGRRSSEIKTKENFRRGRGKNSPFLLTSLLVCKHCGFKLQGCTHHAVQTEAERLLDIATPANRDFVDERLGKIRVRKHDLEARLSDLERVEYEPVDLEAATTDALAYVGRFREVLEEGSLEQRKEFLRGFVAEIAIDPNAARGTITYYELPVSSLMGVPGARHTLLETIRSKRQERMGGCSRFRSSRE